MRSFGFSILRYVCRSGGLYRTDTGSCYNPRNWRSEYDGEKSACFLFHPINCVIPFPTRRSP